MTASTFNSPMMECTRRGHELRWMNPNPLEIKDGYMTVSTCGPGLGVELDQDYLKSQRAEGEPWWGVGEIPPSKLEIPCGSPYVFFSKGCPDWRRR